MAVELAPIKRGSRSEEAGIRLFKVTAGGEAGRRLFPGDRVEIESRREIRAGDLLAVETPGGKLRLAQVEEDGERLRLMFSLLETFTVEGVVVGVLRKFEKRPARRSR